MYFRNYPFQTSLVSLSRTNRSMITTYLDAIEDDTRADSAICRYPTNQRSSRPFSSPFPFPRVPEGLTTRHVTRHTIFFPILSSIERDPTIALTITEHHSIILRVNISLSLSFCPSPSPPLSVSLALCFPRPSLDPTSLFRSSGNETRAIPIRWTRNDDRPRFDRGTRVHAQPGLFCSLINSPFTCALCVPSGTMWTEWRRCNLPGRTGDTATLTIAPSIGEPLPTTPPLPRPSSTPSSAIAPSLFHQRYIPYPSLFYRSSVYPSFTLARPCLSSGIASLSLSPLFTIPLFVFVSLPLRFSSPLFFLLLLFLLLFLSDIGIFLVLSRFFVVLASDAQRS